MNLISQYDPLLSTHLKESKIFRGTSSSIQNDLIAAISTVILKNIKKEIEETDFVALILDETSDIANKSQLSTVFRYIDENCEIQERFLSFTDVSGDRTAAALFEHVQKVLKENKCEKKLIAQTYDGAAVMAGEVSGLNKRVQEIYPSATFIHCYSHLLNLTLQQSASKIKECTLFFHTMSGLSAFFSKSSKRSSSLKNFIHRKLPMVVQTRWNFNSRLINIVKEYYDMLVEFFCDVLDNSSEWDTETILKTRGFVSFLREFKTRFLISVFAKIFSFSDVVFDILQSKSLDIVFCAKTVDDLFNNIQRIRDEDFMSIYNEAEREFIACREDHVATRRACDKDKQLSIKRLFDEILDNVLVQIKERFKSIDKFHFFSLLNCNMFEHHSKTFPDNEVKSLQKHYGSYFDIVRLKTELTVMYSSSEFREKSISELLEFMHINQIYMGMPEVYKLIKLTATIPATTSSAERSFSALKRINTYCRSTQGQERLSSLALLCIEKKVLAQMKLNPTFYDQVIEIFIEKNRREEFVFK